MGCNRVLERIAAATGNLKAVPTIFQTVKDVPNAGVLCALPSLLENGIINKIHNYFKLPDGFYSLIHIILFLGFMALARIKSIEQLRYSPPGEWGKLLGLDRIPEVKTIREKIKILAENGEVGLWAGELSEEYKLELTIGENLLVETGGQTNVNSQGYSGGYGPGTEAGTSPYHGAGEVYTPVPRIWHPK